MNLKIIYQDGSHGDHIRYRGVHLRGFGDYENYLSDGSIGDHIRYSRTSMARTRRDRRWEFDPSMCSSDT